MPSDEVPTRDLCRHCGTLLGFGLPSFHLSDCGCQDSQVDNLSDCEPDEDTCPDCGNHTLDCCCDGEDPTNLADDDEEGEDNDDPALYDPDDDRLSH